MQVLKATVHGQWPIYFGPESRELLLEEVERLAADKIFILTDRTVEALHAETIKENLPQAADHEIILFNEGEENKNLATLEHVAGDLLRAGATERSLILNVGGGVVLNMGGLAASLLGRGVRFAHVPTTFGAQWNGVNSNRHAIHFVGRRDALGVHRAPEFVIVDPFFLETEPERQVKASLADYARQALVVGGTAFESAEKTFAVADFHKSPVLEKTLEACLHHALKVGADDPRENGAILLENYGHAVGRALQSLSDGRLLLPEADYYGVKVAAAISRGRGLMSAAEHARHEKLLAGLRLDAPYPAHVRTDHLIFKLHGNNKTLRDGLKMMLLEGIGKPAPEKPEGDITDAEATQAIEKVRADALL